MTQTTTVDRRTASLPSFPIVSITLDDEREHRPDPRTPQRRLVGVEDLDRLRGCGRMALRRAEGLLRRIEQHCRRRHDAYVPTWSGALHRELELAITSIANDLADFSTKTIDGPGAREHDITALCQTAGVAGDILFAWYESLASDGGGNVYVEDLERFTAAIELIADELAAVERRRATV